MDTHAEDESLLAAAASIADGTSVNWDDLRRQAADPVTSGIVDQLQVLHHIAALRGGPGTWGTFGILERIGRGSFGTVYRAYDPDLQREVALKIIGDASIRAFDHERAVTEARLLARVRHPNVVTVFGAQQTDEQVGVWMEFINGQTLDELVKQHGRFSAREAMLMGVDLCRALAAVHGANLLHGDVKAHNVMREQGGRIVLMDFGAGRDLHAVHQSPQHDVVGTPLYLAPEVFAGRGRTKASDIYSLGVLLYYLVTGAYPVEGDTRTEVERKHQVRTPPRHLRDVRADLPDAFIRVVEGALAEDPEQRYGSAGAFEAALTGALGTVATRSTAGRRRLAVAAAFGAVAIAGVAYWGPVGEGPDAGIPAAARTGPAATASGPAAPAASPDASTYQIDAALYRFDAAGATRLEPNTRVAPGDRLFLQIGTSVPVHVYVVNEDDRGESYLLFPLPGQALANPLPAGGPHRLPGNQSGREVYWQVTSAGGREHFLIFVSPDRLPAFEQMFAALPSPSADEQVQSARLSSQAVGVLRGVGGLAAPPARAGQSARLSAQFTTPLTPTTATAQGLWVRQVTFENPGN